MMTRKLAPGNWQSKQTACGPSMLTGQTSSVAAVEPVEEMGADATLWGGQLFGGSRCSRPPAWLSRWILRQGWGCSAAFVYLQNSSYCWAGHAGGASEVVFQPLPLLPEIQLKLTSTGKLPTAWETKPIECHSPRQTCSCY
jgi:hypothetical protein